MSTRKTAKLAAVESPAAEPNDLKEKIDAFLSVWDVYEKDLSAILTSEIVWSLDATADQPVGHTSHRAEPWQWVVFYAIVQDAAKQEADDLVSFGRVLSEHAARIEMAAARKRGILFGA